jgi:putative oxidoreductase
MNCYFVISSLNQSEQKRKIKPYGLKTQNRVYQLIFKTDDTGRTILVRLIIGLIFLTEGIQKFLFPDLLGTGRFLSIGFSNPAFWAYFTGTFEIICGTFIIIGFITRPAAIPLIIIMITAFISTKVPILIHKGFWSWAHEYRTDFAMSLLLIYLLVFGAGRWSFDREIARTKKSSK